ncbi:uncharacterized protein LOC111621160 [Centruroides sculpturatus]|uniref:uncharacterized protein LOC111621160 n=1 Tax=Centruroides sculpturatus TaxID=218467 RepID=UPI000C6E8BBA|nr:uncharacterized protein LOC111621160 [Centruroides sculpturatus]
MSYLPISSYQLYLLKVLYLFELRKIEASELCTVYRKATKLCTECSVLLHEISSPEQMMTFRAVFCLIDFIGRKLKTGNKNSRVIERRIEAFLEANPGKIHFPNPETFLDS